jgi:hypothetical protein
MFALIGILVMARHDLLPAIACFAVAVGCALRARSEWNRERA